MSKRPFGVFDSARYDTRGKPTHVYYNVNIVNGSNAPVDPVAELKESRAAPLIDNPADYYMSVVRFAISTQALPLHIVPVRVGLTDNPTLDPNLTVYQVTLVDTVNNVTASVPVMWAPQVNNAKISEPREKQDISSAYYFCYSIEHMVKLVNQALRTAWATIRPNWPAYTSDWAGPQLSYDPRSNTFDFMAPLPDGVVPGSPSDIFGEQNPGLTAADSAPVQVWFNEKLAVLFPNFATFEPNQLDPALANLASRYRFFVSVRGDAYIAHQAAVVPGQGLNFTYVQDPTNLGSQVQFYVMEQDYPNLNNWKALNTIVLQSASFPFRAEAITAPTAFGVSSSTDSTSSATFSILTDFQAPTDVGYEYRQGYVFYTPSGEYRLTDLMGEGGAMNAAFDLKVMWTDRYFNMHPLELPAGCNVQVKIMFRRKDVGVGLG